MTTFGSTAEPKQPSAVDIFKQQAETKTLISKYSNKDYDISFGEVEMGGHCGFVGCDWNKLVSMVITAKRANSPSLTYLAVVSGQVPDRGTPPKVRFVDLTDMDPAKLAQKL